MKFLSYALILAVTLASFVTEAAADRRRRKRHRGSSVPAALRGGEAAQRRHNRQADADDLSRLETRGDLERFIDKGLLVPVEDTRSYYLDAIGGHDPGHEAMYRHARPWTKRFLDRELGAGRAKFGTMFKITSLVRTGTYQGRICRSGNGAAICGDDWWEQSLHLTGATVDISKGGMGRKTLAWMRRRLVRLQQQGLVSAIEERGAFHVFVRKAYGKAAKKAKKAGDTKGDRRKHGRTR